ncbi:probable LRR receptor-like serine/threonine-protein kinase At3g47570 [Oryza brachyantha]|uniref:non-specific serine/threonine protein kinase n=1 Tax=Oryza brachyantha TaxID=4533 RepID=J3N9P4_ORYBR|nr:probable LRR receptor-like serine/threonine-protein kinase At3g47570 [Oryza brachyantha]
MESQLLLPLLLLAFIHLLNPLSVSAQINDDSIADRKALLCLKSQLHDPSGALASWGNASLAVCDWNGVTCSKSNPSRVLALDLESQSIAGQIFPCVAGLSFLSRLHMPGNQLNGTISPEVGQLTRLRYLNLSVNSLTGEIPETISSCSLLEIVDLFSNSIEGQIPPGLAQCSFLQQIILSDNNIHGSIPLEIGQLSNLSALFIPNNKLTGTIPQLFQSRRTLVWVNLQNNSLSGEIPPSLFNSTAISYIDLSSNKLSGSIPMFSLASSLRYLSLTGNNLSGAIPTSIANLPSLSTLTLSGNNLQGTIPESISKLSSLQILDLSYNKLSGTVPLGIYRISSLTYLNFGANRLSGRIPTNIGYTLPNLMNMILEGNQFEGEIPTSLANALNLETIYFRKNSFTGVIPSLGSLSRLTYLDLGDNKLEAGDWSFMSSLANCTLLDNLWLDRNNLQGIIPASIANLPKGLKVLILIQNQISGSIPSDIEKLSSLTVFQMDYNMISGKIPSTLVNLGNLSILSLSYNRLSGEIPQSIGKLVQLTKIYLQENYLTGQIPSSLSRCRNLVKLNLSRNSLSGSIPSDLFSISTLSEGLDISYNQLTGQIPPEIGRLINLNSLNISHNQLSGEIPSSLGQCLLLESVNLESNFLQGRIPNSLIQLRGINEMDLSENNLSGEIPTYFQSFEFLHTLNLSFNNLEGPVPNGGVFANSSDVFIEGNKMLCASSPMLKLPPCEVLSTRKNKTRYILIVVIPVTTVLIVSLASVVIILLKKRNGPKLMILTDSFRHFNKLSYNDLYKATDGFSSMNLVGSGNFGLVYKGRLKFDEHNVAIKVFRLDQNGAPNNFFAECEALKNIRHRNLIKVISLCSTYDPSGNEFKALILEYKTNGNLESWVHPKAYSQRPTKQLSLGSRIRIAVDIAAALDYLHNRCTPPLVHCDLKPSNVLLDDDMTACLSDFGLAKFLQNNFISRDNSSSTAGLRGSIGYIAPEYGMGGKISTEGDVYSFGIILLEMITGKRPTDEMFQDGMDLHSFVESAFPHQIKDILEPTLTECHEGEEQDDDVVEIQNCAIRLAKLGLLCTEPSPKDRPTMDDVYAEMIFTKEKYYALVN